MKGSTKFSIINNIWKRIGGTIPRMQIRDAAIIIENYIVDEIKNKKSITVENFGTFYPKLKKDDVIYGRFPVSLNKPYKMAFVIHEKFKLILKTIKKEFKDV